MKTLAITEEKKIFVGQSFLVSKTMIQTSGNNLSNAGVQRPNMGGQEIIPTNTTAKQTVIDENGAGFVSHIFSPTHLAGATTIFTLTIDGKIKEYTFTQGVHSSKSVFCLSLGSSMGSEILVCEVPFILSSMAMGKCIEFQEGFKLEYQCDNVNTLSTGNANKLHVIYNMGYEFDYSAARKESVSEW